MHRDHMNNNLFVLEIKDIYKKNSSVGNVIDVFMVLVASILTHDLTLDLFWLKMF